MQGRLARFSPAWQSLSPIGREGWYGDALGHASSGKALASHVHILLFLALTG